MLGYHKDWYGLDKKVNYLLRHSLNKKPYLDNMDNISSIAVCDFKGKHPLEVSTPYYYEKL